MSDSIPHGTDIAGSDIKLSMILFIIDIRVIAYLSMEMVVTATNKKKLNAPLRIMFFDAIIEAF
jgi:hypothetical protein